MENGGGAYFYSSEPSDAIVWGRLLSGDVRYLYVAIFQERGWEFIGEAKLYYDELRTDRLGKRLKEFMKRGVAEGMYLFQELQFVPQKNFLWKIPQGDLDSNPALEQNPDNISAPLN